MTQINVSGSEEDTLARAESCLGLQFAVLVPTQLRSFDRLPGTLSLPLHIMVSRVADSSLVLTRLQYEMMRRCVLKVQTSVTSGEYRR